MTNMRYDVHTVQTTFFVHLLYSKAFHGSKVFLYDNDVELQPALILFSQSSFAQLYDYSPDQKYVCMVNFTLMLIIGPFKGL